MCRKRQKQGSRQARYSSDALKRDSGRTSAPLLFSNTFWVMSSTNFRADQNKCGANALCFSHSWTLICVKALTFPQVSARKGKLKSCYQQPRFSGWKKEDFWGWLWFTTRRFLSRHTWNGCVAPAFCRERGRRDQADNLQLASCFRATLMQKHRGPSDALLDFLHPPLLLTSCHSSSRHFPDFYQGSLLVVTATCLSSLAVGALLIVHSDTHLTCNVPYVWFMSRLCLEKHAGLKTALSSSSSANSSLAGRYK